MKSLASFQLNLAFQMLVNVLAWLVVQLFESFELDLDYPQFWLNLDQVHLPFYPEQCQQVGIRKIKKWHRDQREFGTIFPLIWHSNLMNTMGLNFDVLSSKLFMFLWVQYHVACMLLCLCLFMSLYQGDLNERICAAALWWCHSNTEKCTRM